MSSEEQPRLVADGGTDETHHECRRCGKNLGGETETCPNCGSEAVSYDF
jgi:ribosomal protein L37E